MELTVEAKVKPKIIPIANNIYNRIGTYSTVDELNQYAQKFMNKNHSRFVCDIENCIDLQQKGRLLVAKAFRSGDVDVNSAKVISFKHNWENHISDLARMNTGVKMESCARLELKLKNLTLM